ncbi:hypothetical protein [Eubacterium sp. ER2]|uniref:hypothetical protein n=1 Tax=Eubacterium sp. ER2 TaxID=1519438 RepID=UPI00051AE988|nr:hypothetical protein [Eubacterium sp. ER2]
MDEVIYFVLQKGVEDNKAAAQKLSELLSNVGVSCEIKDDVVLRIALDTEQFQNVTKRKAGQKKKIMGFKNVMPETFLKEYEEKGVGFLEEKYHISRRTAYRRVAQARAYPGEAYWYRYDEHGNLR